MAFRSLVSLSLFAFALFAQQSGFDVTALDRAANPCVDFYQYACGAWMAANPIPPDRIEARGTEPVKPMLDRIQAMGDKAELAPELARLHRRAVGALFDFSSGPDFRESTRNIAQADQGGLGMPDRDYYLKSDAKSQEVRDKYVAHLARMFGLLGDSPAEAKVEAQTVMRIETALAKSSLDLVARRDPANTYHKLSRQDLIGMAPSFAWQKYLEGIGAPGFESVNVIVPEFFKGLEGLIRDTGLPEWKTYLTWHVLHESAPLLPAAFVEENFAFFGRTLNGAKELRPRWKRCVDSTDQRLGDALGRKYVDRTFGVEGKQRTLAMVETIEKALGQDIQGLTWMTPATKQKAVEKLRAITNKIGFPDKWKDYSTVKVARDDALGNAARADEFEFNRQIARIGKPVDRSEWFMTPPTVNAYYSPEMNNINFPAGILQPPFYSNEMDDAVNFGAIGAVIGHELTHGFDDEGRHFDAEGNLNDWWTAEDGKEFEKRAQCFVDEYAKFTVAGGVHLNGKLTLGENTADNGGVRLAMMALLDRLAGKPETKIDGFTPAQRFFLGWGQIWCQNVTPENARLRAQMDPHSPGQDRVNGVVQNMPEFQKAFGCTAGQPMVSPQACRVW